MIDWQKFVDEARELYPESYNQDEYFVAHEWVIEAMRRAWIAGFDSGQQECGK